MKATWCNDVEGLREDMRKHEERLRGEAETAGKKYAKLLEEVKAHVLNVEQLREQDTRIRREVEEEFREQILALKEVQSSSAASQKAEKMAQCMSFVYFSITLPYSLVSRLTHPIFFHLGTWRVSWPAYEYSCSLQANRCLMVRPRSLFSVTPLP